MYCTNNESLRIYEVANLKEGLQFEPMLSSHASTQISLLHELTNKPLCIPVLYSLLLILIKTSSPSYNAEFFQTTNTIPQSQRIRIAHKT